MGWFCPYYRVKKKHFKNLNEAFGQNCQCGRGRERCTSDWEPWAAAWFNLKYSNPPFDRSHNWWKFNFGFCRYLIPKLVSVPDTEFGSHTSYMHSWMGAFAYLALWTKLWGKTASVGAAESVASVGLQLGIRACFTTIRPLVILGVFLKIVLVNMKAEHLGPSELGVPLRPPALKILAETLKSILYKEDFL